MNVISLQNICFRRNSRAILDGVDWTVERGRHCALLGANGSGKTTLLKIVTGYLWPTAGTVEVLGNLRFFITVFVALIALMIANQGYAWFQW